MLIELPNTFGDGANNMAVDSALIETLPSGIAVFRHYGWTEPTISFGYTQKFLAVREGSPPEITLCRRPTAGGIVDHRNDWTYAFILNKSVPAASCPPTEFYAKVHQAIQQSLQACRINTRLAPCPRACSTGRVTAAASDPAAQCFVTPAFNDVLLPNGRKIAGAALKRTRNGLLLQGSIDRASLPDLFPYPEFQKSLTKTLAATFGLPMQTDIDLRTLFNGPVIDTARKRFKSDAWTQKR